MTKKYQAFFKSTEKKNYLLKANDKTNPRIALRMMDVFYNWIVVLDAQRYILSLKLTDHYT